MRASTPKTECNPLSTQAFNACAAIACYNFGMQRKVSRAPIGNRKGREHPSNGPAMRAKSPRRPLKQARSLSSQGGRQGSRAKLNAKPQLHRQTSEPRSSAHDQVLQLDRFVPALLNWVANKLNRGSSSVYRKRFGIGITEWRVMALLAIEGEVTANRVVEFIGLNRGATSRALQALEERGLVSVRASGTDGRAKLNTLTKAGKQLHREMLPVVLDRERRLLRHLSPSEVDVLIELLHRLHATLPELEDEAGEPDPD